MGNNQSNADPSQDGLRILITGASGVGKTSITSRICATGASVESPKRSSSARRRNGKDVTNHYTVNRVEVFGQKVLLVDAPLDNNVPLSKYLSVLDPGPHCILLVNKITCGGPESDASLSTMTEVLGGDFARYGIVVYTHADYVTQDGKTIEDYLLLDHHKKLLQECQNRYVVFDNTVKPKKSENKEQVRKLFGLIERTIKENEGSFYSSEVIQAASPELKDKGELEEEGQEKVPYLVREKQRLAELEQKRQRIADEKKKQRDTKLLKEKQKAAELEKKMQKIAEEKERDRNAKKTEKQRIAEEKERQRTAQEKEKKRLAEEKEAVRIAEVKERERIAEEKEKQKATEEAEKRRIVQEKEEQRAAEMEKERKKIADEKEKEMIEKEKEKLRVAEETEARLLTEDRKRQRIGQEREDNILQNIPKRTSSSGTGLRMAKECKREGQQKS
ncbi:uncharacterized protein [Amphiura filiformis]|uniref:uncharacterized protein n=1 Tax=Amphiura filiformis TaxID=82378 RepID=UPI003B2144FC